MEILGTTTSSMPSRKKYRVVGVGSVETAIELRPGEYLSDAAKEYCADVTLTAANLVNACKDGTHSIFRGTSFLGYGTDTSVSGPISTKTKYRLIPIPPDAEVLIKENSEPQQKDNMSSPFSVSHAVFYDGALKGFGTATTQSRLDYGPALFGLVPRPTAEVLNRHAVYKGTEFIGYGRESTCVATAGYTLVPIDNPTTGLFASSPKQVTSKGSSNPMDNNDNDNNNDNEALCAATRYFWAASGFITILIYFNVFVFRNHLDSQIWTFVTNAILSLVAFVLIGIGMSARGYVRRRNAERIEQAKENKDTTRKPWPFTAAFWAWLILLSILTLMSGSIIVLQGITHLYH